MENASKALIMAGSILLSLLVIGTIVFMYYQLSDVQQVKSEAEATAKVVEYGKKFEQYNKTLYGSELLSLANLRDDYNRTQAKEKGYKEVEIKVIIKNRIDNNEGKIYVSEGNQDISEIVDGVIEKGKSYSKPSNNTSLENDIGYYETDTSESYKKHKTIKYYSQRSYREIAKIYDKEYSSTMSDDDIKNALISESGDAGEVCEDIEKYKLLKSVYREFKNHKFSCKVKYDENTGRIKEMLYEEK